MKDFNEIDINNNKYEVNTNKQSKINFKYDNECYQKPAKTKKNPVNNKNQLLSLQSLKSLIIVREEVSEQPINQKECESDTESHSVVSKNGFVKSNDKLLFRHN